MTSAAATTFACSQLSLGTQAFQHATAMSGCTQEDIPAIEIYLASRRWTPPAAPAPPYIHIEAAGIQPGTRRTVPLSPLTRDPAQRVLVRAEMRSDDKAGEFLTGSLQVFQAAAMQQVEGEYHFCSSSGTCMDGKFVAPWFSRRARCG